MNMSRMKRMMCWDGCEERSAKNKCHAFQPLLLQWFTNKWISRRHSPTYMQAF